MFAKYPGCICSILLIIEIRLGEDERREIRDRCRKHDIGGLSWGIGHACFLYYLQDIFFGGMDTFYYLLKNYVTESNLKKHESMLYWRRLSEIHALLGLKGVAVKIVKGSGSLQMASVFQLGEALTN